MFGLLDISSSALVAQRTRMETIASNMANTNSYLDSDGNYAPFRRRIPVFAAGDPSTGSRLGVHVSKILFDQSPFRLVREPGNPYADEGGYVRYPNIDPTTEMINALEASRAYEANITAAEATKSIMRSSLRLIA